MVRFLPNLRFGFCVLNYLSILSDYAFTRETDTKEPKAEQYAKLPFLNNGIDKNNNFDKLPRAKWLLCINLNFIYNCSAFGSSQFCVSFSRERKFERIQRKFKTQNSILRRQLVVMLRTMDNVAVFFALLMLFIFIFR